MDFDFSTLLYILFAIVYFVFTSGKKKKKQQANRPVPPLPNTDVEVIEEVSSPTFEDLLKEFTGQSIERAPKPVVAEEIVENKIPANEDITMAYDHINHSDMDSKYERFDEFKIEEEPQENLAALLQEAGGARKAFIYSEIFKRKY